MKDVTEAWRLRVRGEMRGGGEWLLWSVIYWMAVFFSFSSFCCETGGLLTTTLHVSFLSASQFAVGKNQKCGSHAAHLSRALLCANTYVELSPDCWWNKIMVSIRGLSRERRKMKLEVWHDLFMLWFPLLFKLLAPSLSDQHQTHRNQVCWKYFCETHRYWFVYFESTLQYMWVLFF